jgi:hypothetical protein
MDIVRPYQVLTSYHLEGGIPPGDLFDNPPAQLDLPEHLPSDYDESDLDMDMDEFKGQVMDECYLSTSFSLEWLGDDGNHYTRQEFEDPNKPETGDLLDQNPTYATPAKGGA